MNQSINQSITRSVSVFHALGSSSMAARDVSKTMLRLACRFSENSPNDHEDDNPIAADELKLK
jgi:hypothetical protein